MVQALQSITNNPLEQPELHFDGENFVGLVPMVTEEFGGIGLPEESTGNTELDSRSIDPLEITDFQKVVREESSGNTTPEPQPEPTPEPEPTPVRPEPTVNTEEQQALEDAAIYQVTGTTGTSATYSTEEVMNNIAMPDDASKTLTVNAKFQNGATFTNNSPKGMTINNLGDEPTDVIIDASESTASNPVTLKGDYNDIYLNGKNVGSSYPNVYGTITVEDNENLPETGVSLNVNLVGDDCGLVYTGDAPVKINDARPDDVGSPTIYAPNASVTIRGKYDVVEATVSENTLTLESGFHANTLKMNKGNVKFQGLDILDFVDSIETEGKVEPCGWNIPDDGAISKMCSTPGIYNITQDIETSSTIGFGILGSGKYQYNLNGHRVATTYKNYLLYMRGTAEVNIYGPGKMENITETGDGYLFWTNSKDNVLNIYSGEFEGKVHTLYSQAGTINVYGGTYKLKDAATADRDVNGNLKFLLNCLDANYANGTAKINVYGGKFYEFNPAVSYSEPNGPVSFVAEGYHVVESTEDGLKVYEVVKD